MCPHIVAVMSSHWFLKQILQWSGSETVTSQGEDTDGWYVACIWGDSSVSAEWSAGMSFTRAITRAVYHEMKYAHARTNRLTFFSRSIPANICVHASIAQLLFKNTVRKLEWDLLFLRWRGKDTGTCLWAIQRSRWEAGSTQRRRSLSKWRFSWPGRAGMWPTAAEKRAGTGWKCWKVFGMRWHGDDWCCWRQIIRPDSVTQSPNW